MLSGLQLQRKRMAFFIDTCRPNRNSQQRRVIIATPIAESSITIDGVTAVVDSGLARAPCYDAATGISRLLTQRISQDSAEQRRGRAGRTQPGESWLAWHMTFSVIDYRISTRLSVTQAQLLIAVVSASIMTNGMHKALEDCQWGVW